MNGSAMNGERRGSATAEEEMRRALAGHGLVALVAERVEIETLPQVLARADQHRALDDMRFVDQARLEKLAHGGHTAADAHVLAAGRALRLLERRVDAVGDEMERRAAAHLEGLARVVGENEDRAVVRRLVAPPAFPAFVGPRAAHGTEHVAAEDPGAEVDETLLGHLVVDAGLAAALVAVHGLEEARREEPFHDFRPAHAERVLQVLLRPGAIAVQRYAEALHADFRHQRSSPR